MQTGLTDSPRADTTISKDCVKNIMKQPPHSIEAEQSVIGGLLICNEAYDQIADLLREDDFFNAGNRLVYAVTTSLIAAGKQADIITVAERLEADGKLRMVGGLEYLGQLAQNVPTAANIRRYAEIVKDRALRRRVIAAGETLAESGHLLNTPISTSIETGINSLETLGLPDGESIVGIRECLLEAIDEIENGQTKRIRTGIAGFDSLTGGLTPGNVFILGARPSMGKTALAMQMAINIAMRDEPALVFSMEMSRRELTYRIMAHLGSVDAYNLRHNTLTKPDYDGMTAAVSMLHGKPLSIDDGMHSDISTMRAKAKAFKRKAGGLGLIVIDYLQLMNGVEGDTRNEKIGEISRSTKRMARELDVPVLVLSQLNRGLEGRADKRPVLADLRESGNIEQDADIVAFLYREEQYSGEWPGVAELIIRKQRNGPLGTTWLDFDGARSRFTDRAPMQRIHKGKRGFD